VKGNRKALLVMSRATIPIGRLTKKIQRHDVLSTIAPPMSGPSTLLIVKTLVMKPTYLPRSRGGTTSPMMANESENNPPPPIPWTPRAITNCHIDCASPQNAEPMMNVTMAIWNKRRRP